MNNKGQSILSEYVMIFFVVIAALVAMTVLVQRGLEARNHDVRNFMVDSVSKALVIECPSCLNAAGISGNKIPYEYEPYYMRILSDVSQNDKDSTGATMGNPQAIGAIYNKSLDENTGTISTSTQLPPQCANGGC